MTIDFNNYVNENTTPEEMGAIMSKIVKIEANDSASQRTKNRIREHGPMFTIIRKLSSAQCFSGNPGILVESDSDNWIGWLGWFPESEVTVVELEDN